MKYLFNLLAMGGATSANLNATVLSSDPAAADAIAWVLEQAGTGARLQMCNSMPAPEDLTAIVVTLPAIAAVHGTAITPASVTVSGGYGPYSYSAIGLPSGLAIDAASGEISGTPAAAGSYPYAVVVSDSAGNQGVATGTVTVS